VSQAYHMPGTAIVSSLDARCVRCNGTDHLVAGDGAIVCRPCIDRLGGIARDPLTAAPRLLEVLQELHSEVASLVRVGDRDGTMLVWEWIADWPVGADQHRTVRGGEA